MLLTYLLAYTMKKQIKTCYILIILQAAVLAVPDITIPHLPLLVEIRDSLNLHTATQS